MADVPSFLPSPHSGCIERKAQRYYLLVLFELRAGAASLEEMDSLLGELVAELTATGPLNQFQRGVKEHMPSLLQELVAEGYLTFF